MEIFLHHIYEYKKRLRRMVLHTAPARERDKIVCKLESLGIDYLIGDVNEWKINVFFGDPWCVDVIRSFNNLNLTNLSDEQDFILGTLLGYDTIVQCRRYLKRKVTENTSFDQQTQLSERMPAMEYAYVN